MTLNRLFSSHYTFPTILGLGVLIRLLYGWWMYDYLLEGDAWFYMLDAKRILDGNLTDPYWPPGIPYLLAGLMALFGKSTWVAIMLMIVMHLVFVSVFDRVAKRLAPRSTVNLLQGIFALYPGFVHHSVAPLTHLPVAICLLGIVGMCMAYQQKPQWMLPVGMGALIGIATLIRPGAVIVLPVVMGWFFLMKKRRWQAIGSMVLVAGFIFMVWEINVYRMNDRFVWINEANQMNVYLGNNTYTPLYKTWWLGSQDEREVPEMAPFYQQWDSIRSLPAAHQGNAYTTTAWHHIVDRPDWFVLRTLNRIRCFFAFDTLAAGFLMPRHKAVGVLVLLLDALCFCFIGWKMIAGGWRTQPSEDKWLWKLLAVMIIAYGVPYFLAFSHPTYHLAIVPLMGILALRPDKLSKPIRIIGVILFGVIQIEWIVMMANRFLQL